VSTAIMANPGVFANIRRAKRVSPIIENYSERKA
jgi:hypothetical protein